MRWLLVLLFVGCGGRECLRTEGGYEVECGCPKHYTQDGGVEIILEVSATAETCAKANAKCDAWCG